MYKQESRAAERKQRDAKVILFGLQFANDIHYNSNLGPILPRFRDFRAFVRRKPLFRYLPLSIPAKISGSSPWSRSVMLGVRKERTLQAN